MKNMNEPILFDSVIGATITFKDLVIKDIKNECSPEEIEILNNNVELWLYHIRVIRRDVEFQLSSNKSKNKISALDIKDQGCSVQEIDHFITRQNKWRINTIKFLTSIERRMLYVKMISKSDI